MFLISLRNKMACQMCGVCFVIICSSIRKTYNFDSLKHHFNVVKLGVIGEYIIFLISA